MKRFLLVFLSVLMLVPCRYLPAAAGQTFTDVKKGSWYYDAVMRVSEEGLFAGTGPNTFSPSAPMTRAMIATVLAKTANADLSGYGYQPFSDVPVGRWYTNAVCWTSENRLVAGVGDGKFDPKANITREQLCVMLYKFDKVFGSGLKVIYNDSPFDDQDEISSWAENAVSRMRMTGVITGRSGNTFAPKASASRAEVAAMLVRFIGDYDIPVKDTNKHLMSISLSKSSSVLEKGKSEKLSAVFTPSDATDKSIVWTSSNPAVASVSSDGTVRALAVGSCVIIVTANDGGFIVSCKYTVKAPRVSSVSLSKTNSSLLVGESERLTAVIVPADASDRNVTWSSGAPWVASVSANGTVTALAAGTAVITVKTADGGFTASCRYTVTEPEPEYPRGIDPSKPMVALTFDDGPCNNTNRILDILYANGAVATFFEVGQNVERYPEIVQRSVALGNEEGSHSYSHPNLQTLSYSSVQNQVLWTNSAFISAIGYAPTLFRPPYGSRNSSVDSAVGMPMIMWSVDTRDWESRNASSVYNITMNNTRDGSVVLMHSLYTTTADALERILPALKAKGYQFVTVSELAKYRGYNLSSGNKYSSFY